MARGMHFIFLLITPMGGFVCDKLAGLGVFHVQSRRFLMVQNFIYLNLGQIFEFWHYIFEFEFYLFEFWRHTFEFWHQNQIIGSFRRVRGELGGSPGHAGGSVIGVGGKIGANPLVHGLILISDLLTRIFERVLKDFR